MLSEKISAFSPHRVEKAKRKALTPPATFGRCADDVAGTMMDAVELIGALAIFLITFVVVARDPEE